MFHYTKKVIVDDYSGALNAVEYLINTGCKRIAHFKGPLHMELYLARLNGYLKALEHHGVEIDEKLIIDADSFKGGYKATCKLLEQGINFDGAFAVNDLTAVGIMKAVKSKGLRIPEDVAVVGFGDDATLSEMVDPSLSSVVQPGFEMGKEATRLLFRIIDGKATDLPQQIKLSTKLKVRKSSNRR